MREYKFRTLGTKQMHYFLFRDVVGNGWFAMLNKLCIDCNNEDHIIMQYIGIEDRNGTGIYEGDILKFYYKNNNEWFGFGFCFYDKDETAFRHSFHEVDDGKIELDSWRPCKRFWTNDEIICEIIGNIYENPELLEEK